MVHQEERNRSNVVRGSSTCMPQVNHLSTTECFLSFRLQKYVYTHIRVYVYTGEGHGNLLVFLPGKSHSQRSLGGCIPWGRAESDMTEQLHFHFSLSCIGEGNGNPLQCSCLENPRDRGAWWAAVNGVAQSDTTEAT